MLEELNPSVERDGRAARLITIPESKTAPPPALSKQEGTLIEALGEREMEVLRLVAEGLSNEAVGAKLFISVGAVKWYLNGIYHKLDVRNRTEAVALARQRHWL